MNGGLGKHEELALWAVLAIGVAALICFVWNVTVTEAEPPDPPPVEPLPDDKGRSLSELRLAPEANANNIGVRLASGGKLGQAIESFGYALKQDRNYLPGHENLLAALVESGRWPEALAAARETEAVHPLGHYLTALTAEGDSRQSLAEDDFVDTDLHRSRPMHDADDLKPPRTDGPSSAVISVDQRGSVSDEAVGIAAVGQGPAVPASIPFIRVRSRRVS